MLELLMPIFYKDKIYTDEPKLFYKLYKWDCGLFTLIAFRKEIGTIIFCLIGIIWMILIKPRIYGLILIDVGLLMLLLQMLESKKIAKFSAVGKKTPAQIRTARVHQFIRKHISTNGKALGKKEWKRIKEYDVTLYSILLCDKCEGACYFYSLEIARIINDSTLVWGAIQEPFEKGNQYYAHAVILRNGYIYDSNMHQSEKYEDFIKLYKFKVYKRWNDEEYSQKGFRANERIAFRKWCEENNVEEYELF